ncbi:MAG: PKD domain-containing protein [Candidatus Thiodiazotropha sp.]
MLKRMPIGLVYIVLVSGCGGGSGGGGDDASLDETDTSPPSLSNPTPPLSTVLPTGTASTSLGVTTDEASVCRYADTAGTDYTTMTGTFTNTGSTTHSTELTGLGDGNSYNYFVRCQDNAGNINTSDFPISFSVANSTGDNLPPVLDPIADISVAEGGTVAFNPTASNPENDPLNYSYTGWMTSDSYTTRTGDAGTHSVTVTVDDGRGSSDSQTVTVTVLATQTAPLIAYVSPSSTNQTIRTIHPDGTHDTLLWQVPAQVDPADGIALGGLSWRPDGGELAFDSGHDWQRSLNIRDLYAVSANGQSLRRITRPPLPEAYDQYPQGTVRFTLDMIEQGDIQLYIEGMDAPYSYYTDLGQDWTFTLTLADFGDNHRQYMRVWDPDPLQEPCNFSEAGWVDVVPGTVTERGEVFFNITSDVTCPVLFSPSWTHDGSALNYLYQEPEHSDPENNLWQVPHSPPAGTLGSRLLDLRNYINRGKPYRIVSGPTAETADELFFLETRALSDVIYYTTASDASNHVALDLGLCPQTTCEILDIEWAPDGSGVAFSRYENDFDSASAAIYYIEFDTGLIYEIIRLPNEAIGNFTISPDSNSVVFERAPRLDDALDTGRFGPRLLCPCALWIMDVDGSNLRILADDGRQPAWRPNN